MAGQKFATLLKINLLIGIFQVFWLQFHLAATVRPSVFKHTSFPIKLSMVASIIHLFSCGMIQKRIREFIKLETTYFLNRQYHYLHIYSYLYLYSHNFKIWDQIKHIVLRQTCPKFWEMDPPRKKTQLRAWT